MPGLAGLPPYSEQGWSWVTRLCQDLWAGPGSMGLLPGAGVGMAPPASFGSGAVCSAVRSPFSRSAWTCLLKVLSLILGFTRVSQLPPRVLEFPQKPRVPTFVCGWWSDCRLCGSLRAGTPYSTVLLSLLRVLSAQHPERCWVMTAPDQCAAVLNTRVLTVVPETMTY